MKILIVSSFFPPQNSIASLRPYSWAKWWSRMGHEVTVLTTVKKSHPSDFNKDLSCFKIISLPIPHPFCKKTDGTADYSASRACVSKKIRKRENPAKRILRWYMNQTGCFNCRFPTLSDFWAKKAKKAVNPFEYDAVISTGGPYSVHFVADYLKKKNQKLVWCVDWRDYWTQSDECRGSALFRWWEKIKDRAFLERADFITSVSDQFCDTYRSLTNTPVYTVYNGYDPADFGEMNAVAHGKEKLLILYAGTIYEKIQSPLPLFQAVTELSAEGIIGHDEIKIVFCGNCEQAMEMAKKAGAEKFVEYLGFLPHEKTISLEKSADVTLFLGHEASEARGVLTGKLFEYLYCSKEIWAVGISNKMQAGEFIERANAGVCFGTDIGKIKQAILNKLAAGSVPSRNKDMEFISQFERKKQAAVILSQFEKRMSPCNRKKAQKILLVSLNAPYDGVAHAGGKCCNYYIKKLLGQGNSVTIIASAEKDEEQKILADKEKYGYDSYVFYRKPLSAKERVIGAARRLFPPTFAFGFVSPAYRKHVVNTARKLYVSGVMGGGSR